MRDIWSKSSITKKLFFCLSLVFMFYIICNFLAQTVFYGGIYTYYQKQNMIKNINNFIEKYNILNDFDDINSAIVDFSNENDSYIMIMSETGEVLHSLSYYMTMSDSNGNMYRFSLDQAVNDKNFAKLALDVGDRITVRYSYMRPPKYSSFYNPIMITKNNDLWFSPNEKPRRLDKAEQSPEVSDKDKNEEDGQNQEKNKDEPEQNSGMLFNFDITHGFDAAVLSAYAYYEASGVITKIEVPTDFDVRESIKRNESVLAIMDVISRHYGDYSAWEDDSSHIYICESGSERYMVLAKKITHLGKSQSVFMVNELQSMDEAITVMKYSYRLWMLAALIIVFITSVILSRIVTKQVRSISMVTSKMEKLDFSKRCDVTSEDELGQLAQNINNMSDKLDKTIRELTEANAKLKSDIEKEREIENQRSEFVAAISHELKTPLAIIRAYSEGLIDGVSHEKQSKYINIIIDETIKMNALVNDMLNNSKLESGAMVMDIKHNNLSELAEKIVLRLSKSAKEKDINIVCDIQENVYADFDIYYLELVINNFITNAIRHTPQGKNIYVSLAERENFCEVAVENEGSFIEEKLMDKIWDRFYKADKSRSGEGTGLGLSIAKNILNLHEARYGVENTQKGVRFSFTLSKVSGGLDNKDSEI